MLHVFVTKQGFVVALTRCNTSCLLSTIASHFVSKDTTFRITTLAIPTTTTNPSHQAPISSPRLCWNPSRLLVLRFDSGHRKEPPLLFHTTRPALGLSQSPAEWESAASSSFKHSSYPSTSSSSTFSSSSTTVRCRPWLPVWSSPFRPVSGPCVPAYSQYLQIIFSRIPSISAVGIYFSVFSLIPFKINSA
jgi:hypothetical protein